MLRSLSTALILLTVSACGTAQEGLSSAVGSTLSITDTDNMSFVPVIQVPDRPVTEKANFEIAWGELTRDMYGRELPSEVNRVDLLNFATLDQEQVISGLNEGTLRQSDVTLSAYCETETSRCLLDDFILGASHPITLSDDFVADSGTWLLRLRTDDSPLSVGDVFVSPSAWAECPGTAVRDGDSSYVAEVDTDSITTLDLPDGEDTLLAWTFLTMNAEGLPLDVADLDVARVLWFSEGNASWLGNATSVVELADKMWTRELEGETSAQLSSFVDDNGESIHLDDLDGGSLVLVLLDDDATTPMPEFLASL